MVITHELTANILKTDTVKFELSFIPASQWLATTINSQAHGIDNASAGTIGEDGGQCLMTNNAADTQFWTQTLTDIYYKCDIGTVTTWATAGVAANKCSHAANTWNTDAVSLDPSGSKNWTPFETDNDSSNPWCTPPDSTTYSPFACTKLICKMQRPLVSTDKVYDWSFDSVLDTTVPNKYLLTTESAVNPAEDYMIIQTGRARVWINSATYSVGLAAPLKYPNDY